MAEIQGTCDPRFESVKQAFASNFDQGLDVGASVAVVLEGELVVDLWGGHADEAKTKPWERDTIVNVWSTTKTMTALSALILADRGELDLHGRSRRTGRSSRRTARRTSRCATSWPTQRGCPGGTSP